MDQEELLTLQASPTRPPPGRASGLRGPYQEQDVGASPIFRVPEEGDTGKPMGSRLNLNLNHVTFKLCNIR